GSAAPSAGTRYSEEGHCFFRQGGDVVTADVRRFATQVNASVSAVCRALGVNRSTVYARANATLSARAVETLELDADIREVFAASGQRYGSPRVYHSLRRKERKVSRKRIEKRMRVLG